MKKLVIIFFPLLVLVSAAGWTQDRSFSPVGKWELTTQFYQLLIPEPYPRLGNAEYPYLFSLQARDARPPERVLEIQRIAFRDDGTATLVTNQGVAGAFYQEIVATDETGLFVFKLQTDSLFGSVFSQIQYVVVGGALRFSYLELQKTPRLGTTDKDHYVTWNLLGEMERIDD